MAKSFPCAIVSLAGHSKATMAVIVAVRASMAALAVRAITLPLLEINPEMLFFGILIDIWVVDYYGVDEVMGGFNRRDGVKIGNLAIHRLKSRHI